jgi:hypothetical protein
VNDEAKTVLGPLDGGHGGDPAPLPMLLVDRVEELVLDTSIRAR